MPDDPEAPRKFYQLKPKEFERVNETPRTADGETPIAPDPGPGGNDTPHGLIDVRDLARQAAGTAPLLGVNGPVNRANEVHGLLQENLARANEAGLNEVTLPPKRRSRRRRDYWLLMAPATLFFATATILTGPSQPLPFVLSLASLVLVNAGLWWVMWHVMDDY